MAVFRVTKKALGGGKYVPGHGYVHPALQEKLSHATPANLKKIVDLHKKVKVMGRAPQWLETAATYAMAEIWARSIKSKQKKSSSKNK